MPFARLFSIASLLLFASLVYAGIASAQTTSYVPPVAYTYGTSGGTSGTSNTSGTMNTGTMTNGTTRTNGTSGTMGSTSSSTRGSVLGASTTNPNVPNTGAGGDFASNLLLLSVSGITALGGLALLLRRRFSL